jgi:Dolichyl-phosphate-mannose-protein mannosyltransferase
MGPLRSEPKQHQSEPRPESPLTLFLAGFLLRVLYITLAHTYRIRLGEDHLQFGWEMGRIARALATGYGYADPFTGHSGPTAWVPPLYPLLLAAVFKIFGVYTAASAWVILTINSVFSAATALVIYEIAARCFQSTGRARSIALWSAWIWALYPAALQYAVHWIWDMALTALVFSTILLLALRVRAIGEQDPKQDPQTTRRWVLFGILWGMIALLNSTILLFLPVCGLWMVLGAAKRRAPLAPVLARATIAALIFFACLAPWMYRNWTVFHAFIPIRGNLGAELHDSILESYNGFTVGTRVPVCDVCPVYIQYKQMGEYAFVQREGKIARELIRTHKARFFQLALKRFYFYWVSVPKPIEHGYLNEAFRVLNYSFVSLAGLLGLALALKQRIPGAVLFAWAFLLLPMTYYFVTVQARFRHPLEPIMTILAVFLFQSATRPGSRSTPEPTA